MIVSFPWTIERDEETYEVLVEGEYAFGSPPHYGSLTYAGDPGDPDEWEITSVTCDGEPFTLTEAEEEKIATWLFENPPEADSYDDHAWG